MYHLFKSFLCAFIAFASVAAAATALVVCLFVPFFSELLLVRFLRNS